MKINKVNIGEIIRHLVEDRKISKASFAKKLNMQRQNIEKTVFLKQSLDTELLRRISEELDCNLFKYYTDDEQCNTNILQEKKEIKAILTIEMGSEKQDKVLRFVFGDNNIEVLTK